MYVNEIASLTIVIPTTGGAGAATGSVETIPIHGFLLDVKVDYDAAAPATTDLTISDETDDMLVLTDTNTDGVFTPRRQICDVDGAALSLYDLIPIHGVVTLDVAQADELAACVTVTLRWITP